MSDDEFDLGGGLFEEPEDFLPPPPPESHFVEYERIEGKTSPSKIQLRLVGSSPLWGHLLWNAGKYTANYIDEHAGEICTGKKVLELGAAAGLPSLVCGLNGAREVVCTDYPDPNLITNIQYNVDHCEGLAESSNVKVFGYIWGKDVRSLCYAGTEEGNFPESVKEEDKFDFVILSDLVFNHNQHGELLRTCRQSMKQDATALVVFSPHRPHLLQDDLEFFTTCEEYELKAEKVEQVNWTPMFEEDDETAEIRARVYCYKLIPQWSL